MRCHISINGELDPSWQEWFEPLALLTETAGKTVLRGSLPDQAALYRVLLKIQSLGLVLLSLEVDDGHTSSLGLREQKNQRLFSDLHDHHFTMQTTKKKGLVMNENVTNYVNSVFAPYEGVKSVSELKADLLSDVQERFRELKSEGKDDETALTMTIESIGDIEQTVQEVANLSHSLERQVVINFGASNLVQSDFAGVTAHQGNFKGSALRGSDFTGADLTGSSFRGSEVREANFARANLTDCDFCALDLADANFREAILVRTNFSASGLAGARFIGVTLADVNLTKTDLRKTTFANCTFLGVDFHYSDLRGLRFDGQTLSGVTFDNAALKDASFQGATLKNVSFRSMSLWSHRPMKSISFDGAMMDKLTYAALKGMAADLSKVTVL